MNKASQRTNPELDDVLQRTTPESAISQQQTCRGLYEEGRDLLRHAGIPDAETDARILLEEACGITLSALLTYPGKIIPPAQCMRYRSLIARRAAHEPTAMILGRWDFCGLTFRVTKDTLIPEQDTECLVEAALDLVEAALEKKPSRILDLCTGSGCILLSLLHFLPDAEGIGTDLSEPALAVARDNAARLGLTERAVFLQGDLWEALKASHFDLIVSNPPYIPSGVIPTLQPEVKNGEPRLALDGGKDGLAFYRRIIPEAWQYLVPGGTIIVEAGFDEAGDIQEMMKAAGFEKITILRDYGGKDRVVSGQRP